MTLLTKSMILVCLIISPLTQAKEQSSDAQWEKAIASYQQQDWLNADIAIVQQGKPVFREQLGFADRGSKRAFKDDTLFPIASLTKQFIAVAILLLNEDKRLSLHQPIIHILKPSHPIWQNKPPAWADEISVHQLLTHTSGLVDFVDEKVHLDKVKEKDILSAMITQIKDKPLKSEPGTQFSYSNTGYLLLYAIIESVSPQHDVDKLLQQRLFRRLGMTQTFLPSPAEEMRMYRSLHQNRYYPSRYVAALNDLAKEPTKLEKLHSTLPYPGGAGLVSTMTDLIKWNNALYQGKILSAKAFKLFTTPHVEDNDPQFGGDFKYGYGIFIIDDNPNNIIYTHGGWLEGIRTQMSYAKGSKSSVIILSNLSPDESQPLPAQYQQVHSLTQLANELQFAVLN